jgi:hypothetical protein
MKTISRPGFTYTVTASYVLIALTWLCLPEVMLRRAGESISTVLLLTVWDMFFVLVSAKLLFL